MNRSDNIIPIRGARPKIEPETLVAVNGGHAVRGLTPAEREYLRRELAPIRAQHELRRMRERKERLQRIVLVAALAVAGFAILCFLFQLGRGAL